RTRPFWVSQRRKVQFQEAVASKRPSGDRQWDGGPSALASGRARVCKGWPAEMCHERSVRSRPKDTSLLLSADHATVTTAAVWPLSGIRVAPDLASQTAREWSAWPKVTSLLSPDHDRTSEPQGRPSKPGTTEPGPRVCRRRPVVASHRRT